jgi:hypothetical protein
VTAPGVFAPLLAWIATLATALFTGGALYASLVEHPARLLCGPPMAVAHFRTSYPRGARLQAPLAVIGCLAGAATWLFAGPRGWLWAGLIVGAVVPFTLVAMLPGNRRLVDQSLPPDSPEVRILLRRWGWLHLARTLLGLVAAGWMLRLLVSS